MKETSYGASALTTILVVSDIESSKKFYIDVLEAELYREYGGTSVVLQLLGNWILLVTGGEPTADKPDTKFAHPVNDNEVSHAYTMRVADCKKAYDILKGNGAEFITPPYDWGEEVRCFFKDPDGYLFEISEYKG